MNERVKAIITIVITAAVNIANIYGWAINADTIVSAVLTIASLVSIVWAWWKNNNVTPEAAMAQKYLDELKAVKRGEAMEGEDD